MQSERALENQKEVDEYIEQQLNDQLESSGAEESPEEQRLKRSARLLEKEQEKTKLLKRRKLCGMVEGCDSIENYEHLNKIHEGVYGIVFRARDRITG